MTTITELLTLEYQSLSCDRDDVNNIDINVCIEESLNSVVEKCCELGIVYNFKDKDVRSLFINYFLISLCEKKKQCIAGEHLLIYRDRDYHKDLITEVNQILKNVVDLKREKISFRLFLSKLKKSNQIYLCGTYFKDPANKLALIR